MGDIDCGGDCQTDCDADEEMKTSPEHGFHEPIADVPLVLPDSECILWDILASLGFDSSPPIDNPSDNNPPGNNPPGAELTGQVTPDNQQMTEFRSTLLYKLSISPIDQRRDLYIVGDGDETIYELLTCNSQTCAKKTLYGPMPKEQVIVQENMTANVAEATEWSIPQVTLKVFNASTRKYVTKQVEGHLIQHQGSYTDLVRVKVAANEKHRMRQLIYATANMCEMLVRRRSAAKNCVFIRQGNRVKLVHGSFENIRGDMLKADPEQLRSLAVSLRQCITDTRPGPMEWRTPIVERMAQVLEEAADCRTDADRNNLVRRIARNTIRRELGLN